MKLNFEQFIFGALFHDIGKLIERSKEYELPEDIKKIDEYSHSKYSAFLIRFLKNNLKNNKFINSVIDQDLEKLVLYHHNPSNDLGLILQISDWISASEREKDEDTKEPYNTIPLISIFSRIEDNVNEFAYPLKKISYDSLMPVNKNDLSVNASNYKTITRDFLNNLKFIDNFDKLISLLEIYLSSIPAQTTGFISDISLFDHLKTTAAISSSIYVDYNNNLLDSDKLNKIKGWFENKNKDFGNEKLFIVLEGDLSNIQDFIFNIPSKKAARSLKGRSVYLSLLARYSAFYIIEKMNLTKINILYLGGGNFQILLPLSMENIIEEIRNEITNIIWDIHNEEVALNIDWIKVSLEEMLDFEKVREKIKYKINLKKLRRYGNLKNNLTRIFEPKNEIISEGESCDICGRKSQFNIEEQKLCSICYSLIEITNSLKDAKYLLENRCPKTKERNTIFDFFKALGYDLKFSKYLDKADKIYAINDFELYKENVFLDGFILGSFNLPNKNFEEIAESSLLEGENGIFLGDDKLAYLKMDVDNLGKIFSELSKLEREHKGASLSRYRTLSNRLELFFSYYLVKYIENKDEEKKFFYPVFIGGDDLFIIGSWNKIIDLVKDIRDLYIKYTAYNPIFKISSSILILKHDYPVIRGSKILNENLDIAKKFKYKDEIIPEKDKVYIFDEIVNWKEFFLSLELRNLIINKISEKEPRSIIFKIEKIINSFEQLLKDSLEGKIHTPPLWRLSYYLREHKEIAEILEKIILENLFEEEKIKNPMIIKIAAKLSEMDTKNN